MIKKLGITIYILMLVIVARSATVSFAWDANSEPDLAGYRMYYGTNNLFNTVTNCGNVTDAKISDLVPGYTYAFFITAYNTSGLESEPSNIVVYTVPLGVNAPPTVENSPPEAN